MTPESHSALLATLAELRSQAELCDDALVPVLCEVIAELAERVKVLEEWADRQDFRAGSE